MARVQTELVRRGDTVACAESLTGGALGEALTSIGGSSAFFVGGVISYATEVKRTVLGVDAEQVITADCAAQMAAGVRRLLGTTWGLATTGVAGPDRQEGQPVGTVYVAISGPVDRVSRHLFEGDRAAIRSASVDAAIDLLREALGD